MTTQQTMTGSSVPQKAPKDILLSPRPDKAMQEMMNIIDAVRNVYMEENEALENADTDKFIRLQKRKVEAADNYKKGINQIIARQDEFRDIDSSLKDRIREKQEEFSALKSRNLEGLERMTRIMERLNNRIMKAARESATVKESKYNAEGVLRQYERRISVGVNESV